MKEDFYVNLREKLESQFNWPQIYMFKFIIPSNNHKLALVEALFSELAQVTIRQSSSNKYMSITAKEMMLSPDEIIKVYKKAGKIEGIISL